MTQVLLINPPYMGNILPGQTWHPIGILTIGSYLKSKGYDVTLIDGVVDGDLSSKLEKTLDDPALSVVGFSVMTSQIKYALPISKIVKEKRNDIINVWGGIHPTLFPEQTINHPLVDLCVVGEGEVTMEEVLGLLSPSAGKANSKERMEKVSDELSEVKGVVHKIGSNLHISDVRNPINLNELPFLDYELLGPEPYINQDYRLYGSTEKRALAVNSARGCPYKCSFCINSVLAKKHYRAKRADRLLDEIDFMVEEYKIDHIDFIDEEFFVIKKRTYEFIEGLEKRDYKVTWSAGTRANYFDPVEEYFTPDFVRRLYKAGCIRWAIGVESGSEKMLEILNKEITREQVLISAKVCKEAGMNTLYTFMIGMPFETKGDIIETLRFSKRLFSIYPDNSYMVGPTIFRPYPGTKLYEACKKKGLKEPDSLESWQEVLDESIDALELGDGTPWIEDPKFVELASFVASQAFSKGLRRKTAIHQLVSIIFRYIANKRIEFNFWKIPIDYYIHKTIKKIMIRLRHVHTSI